MSVLIIGGTGFIGASLARRLAGAGETVVCMDTSLDPWHLRETATRVKLVRGDISQFDEVAAAILENRVNQVVCLAYVLSAASETALHLGVRVNVLGMDNVFEAARLMGVRKVLYASSVAYHGANPSPEASTITEETPARPLGAYGWQKQFNEVMAARYAKAHGMTMVAVRPPVVFGPGRRLGQIAQAQMINEAALGRPVRVPARPKARAALVYVDDVAELFFLLATAPSIRHAAYLTGGEVVSYERLADIVRELIPSAEISFDPVATSTGYGLSYDYDHTRAREEFGYRLPSLAERVRDSINATRTIAGLPDLAPS